MMHAIADHGSHARLLPQLTLDAATQGSRDIRRELKRPDRNQSLGKAVVHNA